jgi:hypothetical protein
VHVAALSRAALGPRAIHSSAAPTGANTKPGASTPTMVAGSPSTVMRRPIARASPSNRLRHAACDSTATCSAAGSESRGSIVRPSAARAPSTRKKSPMASPVLTISAPRGLDSANMRAL